MKLVEVTGTTGVVEISGVRRTTDLSLVAPVEPGQYVIVHAGFAIAVTDEEEARKSIELFEEMARGLEIEGEK